MSQIRVLIVGAGAAGLAAAVELARRGLRPEIIDRDDGPTPLSKAVGVSPHTLELLEPSGVTARLLDAGLRIRRVDVHQAGREIGALSFDALPHRYDFLLSLPQSRTETILAETLKGLGVDVAWGTRLLRLEERFDGVTATLVDPDGTSRTDTWDIVLGADGAESTVRDQAGVRFEGHAHHRLWSIADIAVDDWPFDPDAAQAFFGEGGDLAFVIPFAPGRRRAVSNTPDALSVVPGGYTLRTVERTDTFHLPIRLAATFQTGRVFLAGDAAHAHSPVGARGMNLGVEDAACFARRLLDRRLEGYTAERRPIARRWIRLSERILAAAQARNLAAVLARNAAIRALAQATWAQRPILRRVAGLVE